MIKKNFYFTLIIALISVSCSHRDKKAENIPAQVQTQTPKVLEDNSSDADSRLISKRNTADIIQRLFEEAISKDSNLKNLVERVEKISKTKEDSLEPYNKYLETNKNYWSSSDEYINQLKDTTIKREMKEAFAILEMKYKKYISLHNLRAEQIDSKSNILSDKMILMKLIVTSQMIYNYQKNELQNIETFNRLIKSYNDLIKDTKSYTEFNK